MISIGTPPDPVQVFDSRVYAIGDSLEDIFETGVILEESLVEGRMEELVGRQQQKQVLQDDDGFTHSFTVEYRIKRRD